MLRTTTTCRGYFKIPESSEYPSEPILAGRVTEKGAGVGLAPLIPEGKRAVAIAINQVTGVSGYINPGSEVDILLTGSPSKGAGQVTTTVLENVSVLSTGHRLEMDPNGKPQNVPVINMLLTLGESELLTLATTAFSNPTMSLKWV